MTEKMNKIVAKVEDAVGKTVDYITEHPIKTLVVVFVAAKVIKWIKD